MNFFLNYFVLSFCLAVLEGVKFRCDYRYTQLGWFKYHEIPATWTDARLQCRLEGAVLASPTTTAIKTLMLESFCKPQIFTGIHAASKLHYYSIDGIPLAEIPHQWAQYEPDNKNNAESCLALQTDGKFSDVRCDEPLPYICHRQQSDVDVNVCGTIDPEYRFDNRTKKCYKFHKNPRQFSRANFECFAEGGHLAIIKSEEEANVLREIFAEHPESQMPGKFYKGLAFVGFDNWGDNTDFTTVHGQSIRDAGYAKFAPSEPSNPLGRQLCGAIYRSGLYDDLACDVHHAFFCEKSPNYPLVCDSMLSQNTSPYTPVCDNDVQSRKKNSEEVDPLNYI